MVAKGTAPAMTADLLRIIPGVTDALPDVEWDQLQVTYPADWSPRRIGGFPTSGPAPVT
jgi:hypothetical protein